MAKISQKSAISSTLPAPLTSPNCDVRGLPLPYDLLVELSFEAFGLSEQQTVELALSVGFVRVPGGWKLGH